jgi:hypothetical protein
LAMDSPKSLRWCYHADVPFSTDGKQFSIDEVRIICSLEMQCLFL